MTIDIIIPTYNRNAILIEALESIQAQTYTHWHCWIAEDGETQETFKAIQPFLEDDRFQYLPGKHSGTPATPRNRAILQGNAQYIAFLDDDDLWLPEKLEKQIEFIKRHPGCALLACNAFTWSGTKNWNRSLPMYFQKPPLGKLKYEDLLWKSRLINSSVMIPRIVLKYSGLQNESLFSTPFGEDYELWLRIGALGEVWLMPDAYVVYREAANSYTSKLSRQEKYQIAATVFDAALNGVEGIPSPLTYPENKPYADACRRARDFYRSGPRLLGKLRYRIALAINKYASSRS
ncbi:glycosyltransferase family 2 protein [Thermodesulfobacteriota bacterium]